MPAADRITKLIEGSTTPPPPSSPSKAAAAADASKKCLVLVTPETRDFMLKSEHHIDVPNSSLVHPS
ncbi:hypothetical protein E2562_030555 [Oryza meyeriana var. granulata]|uniref:Uncharacterized protein n=1 Tax=Oryza meyeriana var. granulata TaxID=110450 RepID=A0A6G1D9C7_9ORYZ|nr:hypothetical protein E2562_030555 [Oryza meyeriana var. granulata]